jgi:hypothetical protein
MSSVFYQTAFYYSRIKGGFVISLRKKIADDRNLPNVPLIIFDEKIEVQGCAPKADIQNSSWVSEMYCDSISLS